jgi:hypothetical protein
MPEMERTRETYDARHFIPLNRAYLCQDCDCVGSNAMHCPSCASEVLLGLANVLDRKDTVMQTNLFRFPSLAA